MMMKIIKKDNLDRKLFVEKVVVYNINELVGSKVVKQWNSKYFYENPQFYLELVDDDYELYNGYKEIGLIDIK